MQLFLLYHFMSQGYDVMGRSSMPLRLLRRTLQKAGYVANSDTFEKLRRARVRMSALVLCVVTTCRKNRLYRSFRLTRVTLVTEKLPSR
jgi:hypothetical protein